MAPSAIVVGLLHTLCVCFFASGQPRKCWLLAAGCWRLYNKSDKNNLRGGRGDGNGGDGGDGGSGSSGGRQRQQRRQGRAGQGQAGGRPVGTAL